MMRIKNGKSIGMAVAVAMLVSANLASAQLSLNGPTTNWVAIIVGSTIPDWYGDQQTGQPESDLVGTNGHPCFFMAFNGNGPQSNTDGTLAFRVRLSRESSPPGFDNVLFIGVDANADGALDLFLGVNSTSIFMAPPGSGANVSPSTTTVQTPIYTSNRVAGVNYSWDTVNATTDPVATSYDLDGNGTDRFLSFAVPFTNVVLSLAARGITGVTDQTPLRYVVATATQMNAINQDLLGPQGMVNSSLTWAALGSISEPYATILVPEPSSALLVAAGLGFLCLVNPRLRRQRFL